MKRVLMTVGICCALCVPLQAVAFDPAAIDAPQREPNTATEASLDSQSQEAPPIASLPQLSSREFRYTATPRLDPLYLDFLALFTFSETLEGNTSAALRLPLNARVGVQWNLDGQRPSLDYRFSSNTVVRLRGSRHGARLVLQAKF